jgi:hypothetical protein
MTWRSARGLALALCTCGMLPAADLRSLAVPGTTLVIGVPADWRTVEPADGTIIRLARPGGGGGLAVSVSVLPAGAGPAAFTQNSLAELQRLAYDFDLLDWDFTMRVGTRTWSRLHFRFVHGETRWEQQLYLTAENGQAVAVACSAKPAEWAAWAPLFERCIAETGGSRPVLAPR